mgnify:FL=1
MLLIIKTFYANLACEMPCCRQSFFYKRRFTMLLSLDFNREGGAFCGDGELEAQFVISAKVATRIPQFQISINAHNREQQSQCCCCGRTLKRTIEEAAIGGS